MDTSPAIKSLQKLQTQINNLNKGVTITANTVNKINRANQQATNSAKQLATGYKKTTSAANGLYRSVARVAGMLLGAKGLGTLITTADTMTGAKNKLNALHASQLGDTGSGGYTAATLKATEDTMNKVFASSQKVRTGYTDMLTNVSKSMTLAGDAFDNNIDNAIRFQEIMSEAYAVAGASQAEMSSSMYQMVQGLGSGILQGDELRSIREGAPLAYKAIEEFAQGVFGAEESLKDLASQGKITSDIVVAAILGAGEQLDASFANTTTTFAQAWQMIKNVATQAFTPVMTELTNLLNSETGAAILNGVMYVIQATANALMWLVNIISAVLTFIVDNWSWVQYIVYFGLGLLIAMLAAMAMQAIKSFFILAFQALQAVAPFLLIVAAIGIVVYMIVQLANTTASGAEFIQQVALMLAYTLMAIALMVALFTGNTTLAMVLGIVALIFAFVALFSKYGGEIMGIIYKIGAYAVNTWYWICNVAAAMGSSLMAIFSNIGVFFANVWDSAKESFWNFCASVVSGVVTIANKINSLLGIFGIKIDTSGLEASVESLRSKADAAGASKLDYKDVGAAWNAGMSTFQYKDTQAAYDTGFAVGEKWSSKLNGFGDKLKTGITNLGTLPSLGTSDFGSFSAESGSLNWAAPDIGGLTNTPGLGNSDLGELLGAGSGSGGAGGALKDIAGDTSKIADSMEMTEEDLDMLRKLAATEFKKEFWVTGINVDMSNYNTVSGDSDLDGIVTKLTDKLYEELNAVSNGVYA